MTTTKVVRIRTGHVETMYVFPTGYMGALQVWDVHDLRKDGKPNRAHSPAGVFPSPIDSYGRYGVLYSTHDVEREAKAEILRQAITNLHAALTQKEKELMALYVEEAPDAS